MTCNDLEQDRQRGAALLIVLLLVATLSVLALALTDVTSKAVRQVTASQARDQAYWDLLGAERAALLLLELQEETAPNIDTLEERWLAAPITVPLEGRLLSARFRDRSACFNVNDFADASQGDDELTADEGAISRFSRYVGLIGGNSAAAAELAASAADFIDSNSSVSSGGAEDLFYSRGEWPYRTAGTYVASVSEMRAVAGWRADSFRTLRPRLCARAGEDESGALNLNTLSDEDAPLLAAQLDERITVSQAQALIAARPDGGYRSASQVLSNPLLEGLAPPLSPEAASRLGTVATMIEFSASVVYGELAFSMTSRIERDTGGQYAVTGRWFGAQE